jgi:hypothetical protein
MARTADMQIGDVARATGVRGSRIRCPEEIDDCARFAERRLPAT